ncbi:PIN domain-containing protein [Nocardia seriolae]|uniref:Ribonuclease VapC n=1 Tax=Nocardia seriolae TaxID=37332 RepID=A0A0B8N7T7_9NOCA|nr:PIN domain-containing protein [Nocardia seriolae]APA95306.1 Ribonuclease VapC2 [Nocardia seriolae]MTJ66549.1 PIN domain-containing protein [Nocardia seriolae]MTJ70642.1 PIN domain-containing protein [Nocardia seriolae]MTJ85555.1 PIN domain-containing protein [Nocardia seriolae]MTK29553.1 PIN domain-containing protein [Nocardia seriolae]
MSEQIPLRLHLIDTSAAARIGNEAVRNVIVRMISDRTAATCVTVDLEAGYSGRNLADVQNIAQRRRALYANLPINESIAERAREVQMLMARHGRHRAAGIVDLMTAAIAEFHGAAIVHYDADFEHIAAVTRQPHVWVVPKGSID